MENIIIISRNCEFSVCGFFVAVDQLNSECIKRGSNANRDFDCERSTVADQFPIMSIHLVVAVGGCHCSNWTVSHHPDEFCLPVAS